MKALVWFTQIFPPLSTSTLALPTWNKWEGPTNFKSCLDDSHVKMAFVSSWVIQAPCCLAAHPWSSGSSHSVSMTIPQPLRSSGVSPFLSTLPPTWAHRVPGFSLTNYFQTYASSQGHPQGVWSPEKWLLPISVYINNSSHHKSGCQHSPGGPISQIPDLENMLGTGMIDLTWPCAEIWWQVQLSRGPQGHFYN